MSKLSPNEFQSETKVQRLEFKSEGKSLTGNLLIEDSVECWSLHCILDATLYGPLPDHDRFLLKIKPNATDHQADTDCQGFLTLPLVTNKTALGAGYIAYRYPIRNNHNRYPEWKATFSQIKFNEMHDDTYEDLSSRVQNISVFLSRRYLDAKDIPVDLIPTHEYRLQVKFVLIVKNGREIHTYASLIRDAIEFLTGEIYKNKSESISIKIVEDSRRGANFFLEIINQTINSNFYIEPLKSLVNRQADNKAMTVFYIHDMEIPDAIGFSIIPGPQQFKSSHSGVFVRNSRVIRDNGPSIGNRMGHEMGHNMGLIHETSCFDHEKTSTDISVCRHVIGRTVDQTEHKLTLAALKKNLMFTGNPGTHLNGRQKYMIQNAPIVNHKITFEKIPIDSLKMEAEIYQKVDTDEIDSKEDFDKKKEDPDKKKEPSPKKQDVEVNKVLFTVNTIQKEPFSNEIEIILSNTPKRYWLSYYLNVDAFLFEENITGFIFKSRYNSNPLQKNHWFLQSLIVKINNRIWFKKSDIGIEIGASLESVFTNELKKPEIEEDKISTTSQVMQTLSVPPFYKYPIAMNFDPNQSVKITVDDWKQLDMENSAFTVQMWIYQEKNNHDKKLTLLSVGDEDTGLRFCLYKTHYQWVIFGNKKRYEWSEKIPEIDLQRWVHLCITYDEKQKKGFIYRNGEQFFEIATENGLPDNLSGSLSIGGDEKGSCFEGKLRNVALWKKFRTLQKNLSDMFFINDSDPELAAYWPMNEGMGKICFDKTVKNNHGVISVDSSWYIPEQEQSYCLLFTHHVQPHYISLHHQKFVDLKSTVVIMAWIRFMQHSQSSDKGTRIIVGNDILRLTVFNGKFGFSALGDNAKWWYISTVIPLDQAGYWFHLCGQYNQEQKTLSIFYNGRLKYTRERPDFQPKESKDPRQWYIGGHPRSRPRSRSPYNIQIKEIILLSSTVPESTIYDYLTSKILDQKYEEYCVAHLPLDEGAGDNVYEVSNGNPLEAEGVIGTLEGDNIQWNSAPKLPNLMARENDNLKQRKSYTRRETHYATPVYNPRGYYGRFSSFYPTPPPIMNYPYSIYSSIPPRLDSHVVQLPLQYPDQPYPQYQQLASRLTQMPPALEAKRKRQYHSMSSSRSTEGYPDKPSRPLKHQNTRGYSPRFRFQTPIQVQAGPTSFVSYSV